MAGNKLNIYNDALRIAEERRLVALSDETEGRRLLDDAWVDAPGYCLEQGEWNFAMRSAQITYSPSVEPPFGYRRAFSKPTDWVRTSAFAYDERFNVPITAYTDEQGYWFADPDFVYVRYISNDPSYGMDMSQWPVTFCKFLSAYLCQEIAPKLTSGKDIVAKAEKLIQHYMKRATATNAMNLPTSFAPQGSWVRSRAGRLGFGWRDRGNRSSLYG
jgi:hypothetical protein